jgi:hypothetical protein
MITARLKSKGKKETREDERLDELLAAWRNALPKFRSLEMLHLVHEIKKQTDARDIRDGVTVKRKTTTEERFIPIGDL